MSVLSWWRGEGRAEEKTGTEDSLPGDTQDALEEQRKAIRAGFRTADQLAATALAVGAITRAFQTAGVVNPNRRTALVTGRLLAQAVSGICLNGQALFLLSVRGGRLEALPAVSAEILGTDPSPASWRYRLEIPAPTASVERISKAGGVLHIRWNAPPHAPWQGRPPLQLGSLTAVMAAQLELFLQSEMRISSGRLFSYGEDSSESSPQIVRKSLQRGGIRTSKILEPHNTALHAYGPKPEPSIPTLRHQTRGEIMGLYGVPEALYFADAGAAAREALRAFVDVTLPEYSAIIEEELNRKTRDRNPA